MLSQEEKNLVKSLAHRHGYSQVFFLASEEVTVGSSAARHGANSGSAPQLQQRIESPDLRAPFWLRPGTSDTAVFEAVFLGRQYDFPLEHVPRVIVDGGANIGFASLVFAHRFPDAKILAVEPVLGNFELLKRNTAAYPTIEPIHAAIWSSEGRLSVTDPGLGAWGFQVQENAANEAESCAAVSIRNLLDRSGYDEIDLLKLDIEGAEEEVFSRGYEDWINRVKVLVIETHEHIRRGSSKPFEEAVAKFPFSMRLQWGELHILIRE